MAESGVRWPQTPARIQYFLALVILLTPSMLTMQQQERSHGNILYPIPVQTMIQDRVLPSPMVWFMKIARLEASTLLMRKPGHYPGQLHLDHLITEMYP